VNLTPKLAKRTSDGQPTASDITGSTAVEHNIQPGPFILPELDDESRWTSEGVKQAQNLDPEMRPVIQWLLDGTRPEWKNILHTGCDTKNYWKQWDSLLLKDGLAYRKFVRTDGTMQYCQLLVPRCLRKELTQLIHVGAAGHLGVNKTREQVQRRAYWTAWRTDT